MNFLKNFKNFSRYPQMNFFKKAFNNEEAKRMDFYWKKKQSELRNTCGKPSPTHLSYKLITQGSSRKAACLKTAWDGDWHLNQATRDYRSSWKHASNASYWLRCLQLDKIPGSIITGRHQPFRY